MMGVYSGGWTPPAGLASAMSSGQGIPGNTNPSFGPTAGNGSLIAFHNNTIAAEAARIDREFQQSSAREAMEFEADQARINREFQQSSAREAMNFEASQAQKQMVFQDYMSSTAYQRAVADLQAAGLNPALAYHQGGAAATAGSMASGVSSSGSSASGRQASGSRASTDMRSVVDMLETVATNAKDERVALYNVFSRILSAGIGAIS